MVELLERIIRGFGGNSGTGLPIGSLTFQHFANFYLGWLNRSVKEQLRVRRYARYMDDMVLWHDDRETLNSPYARLRDFAVVLAADRPVRSNAPRGPAVGAKTPTPQHPNRVATVREWKHQVQPAGNVLACRGRRPGRPVLGQIGQMGLMVGAPMP